MVSSKPQMVEVGTARPAPEFVSEDSIGLVRSTMKECTKPSSDWEQNKENWKIMRKKIY